MGAADLPENERKLLQYVTIIGIAALIYLFFIKQQIITAMIAGAALLLAQRGYLWLRKKKPRP